MKKLNLNLLVLLILTIPNLLKAQSYVGHSVDNYSGVHGLISNPSNVVDSRVKADVNLFSASVFGGSDYFGINVSDVIKSDGGFDFESDAEKFPSNANNFFLNADILGPSFMFNLTPKSSIGMVSRVRAFFNINNISGELYENLADNFDTNEDFMFNSENLTGTIHAWAEVGLVYGRVLVDKEQNFLKGGVTLKYLQGAGGVFINSPSFTGDYDATNETLNTTGSLQYGISQDFDNDDIEFSNLTSGFGADIGFTYEFRPRTDLDSLTKKHNKYKLKIGASITDIGSINYKESVVTTYDLNKTVNASDYDEDTEDFLDDNYTSTEETIAQKINLPTAFHFLADYNIKNKLYVSLQTNLSLVKKSTTGSNNIINSVTLAPRLETKWFSIYSPVSFRQYGDFAWGGGLRVGPLMVGSGSILSNLLSDTTKTTDVYVGLKIPIYQ
ncbi:DUF5723 family protein [Algibacter pectinivorans]|uniref:DUF5723 domain-containing protein n=1 Tax=Algibacter pectinivorans TaxID=870482 RepID=A0A1I1QEL6_9FLAO|nr:DUF5723 family protein [Algibacter pectinivorans]SFD20499.1 hypothetical protein SAMN04487987_10683 [Algibacter pectinivorans]